MEERTMIQKPLFAPQTEWLPPEDFPDLSNPSNTIKRPLNEDVFIF